MFLFFPIYRNAPLLTVLNSSPSFKTATILYEVRTYRIQFLMGHPKTNSRQGCFIFVQWFLRRRLKCKKLRMEDACQMIAILRFLAIKINNKAKSYDSTVPMNTILLRVEQKSAQCIILPLKCQVWFRQWPSVLDTIFLYQKPSKYWPYSTCWRCSDQVCRQWHAANRWFSPGIDFYKLIWFDFGVLTPLSTIFQLYHGDQF